MTDTTNTSGTQQKEVIIYSTPTCHFCHMAKDFFTENHIAFTDYNVATDLDKRKEMIQVSGQMGVPVITVKGFHKPFIVGFNEPELREALGLDHGEMKMAA